LDLVGVALVGVALVGVALVGVALVGVALVGVALVGVALVGVTHHSHIGTAARFGEGSGLGSGFAVKAWGENSG
jgi:hypothetical protein